MDFPYHKMELHILICTIFILSIQNLVNFNQRFSGLDYPNHLKLVDTPLLFFRSK